MKTNVEVCKSKWSVPGVAKILFYDFKKLNNKRLHYAD
jgi:hypothetical protein